MKNSCLECGSPLEIPSDLQIGEITDCENCGVALEVTHLNPISLTLFEEEEK